ncbi:hypothetical protein D1007_36848 [Hordeum vulgare]|nr:hypothetical protein D1007_36848 [Hordeum vulgare]
MLPPICITAADLAGKERRLPTRSRSEEKTAVVATPQGLCPVTPRTTAAEGEEVGTAVRGGRGLPGAGRLRRTGEAVAAVGEVGETIGPYLYLLLKA